MRIMRRCIDKIQKNSSRILDCMPTARHCIDKILHDMRIMRHCTDKTYKNTNKISHDSIRKFMEFTIFQHLLIG